MWATSYGQIEVIKILLRAGAAPNASDHDRRTALLYALEGFGKHTEAQKKDALIEWNKRAKYRRMCLMLLHDSMAERSLFRWPSNYLITLSVC